MNKERVRMGVRLVVKAIVLAAIVIPLVGLVVMWLWNALVPALFGLPEIGFWQSLGVFVLARILVGGFRGGGHHHGRHHFREHWKHMSDEERAAFRRGIGRDDEAAATPGKDV